VDPGSAVYDYREPSAVPLLRPYGSAGTVRFTGSSHDEQAFITKDPGVVGSLNRHLVDKIDAHRRDLELVDLDRQQGAPVLVVAYGITSGAAREAVEAVRGAGARVSLAVPKTLWPVPERALGGILGGVGRVVVAELNDGLYRREIERLAGKREVVGINRLDGRLITPEEIAEVLM
jgi:2-oxoglutarate ferredoxin oxidoreductase subunit alpha